MDIIGQTVVASTVSGTQTLGVGWTPWFPKQGRSGVSHLEIVGKSGETRVRAAIYGKDPDDTGDGAIVGSTETVTTVGTHSFLRSGMPPLIRYRVEVSFNGDVPSGLTTVLWAHLRFLPPTWLTDGAQAASIGPGGAAIGGFGFRQDDTLRVLMETARRSPQG